MLTFDPAELPVPRVHQLLLGGVAPRPIAFVGTLDAEGTANLAPFSFFNAFGANPPVVCFSPAFSGKTGEPKDTFLNILESKECTISIVNFEMVDQMNLAASPYPRGVDEFAKSGFTKLPSTKVKAFGVAESPFVMEAKLLQHIDLGGKPAAGNLLICEIVLFHIKEEVMDEQGRISPLLMDQVSRMGGPWYSRSKEGLFSLSQPTTAQPGFDSLPSAIRNSPYLSGSDLAKLLTIDILPLVNEASIIESGEAAHLKAKQLISTNDIPGAWSVLLR